MPSPDNLRHGMDARASPPYTSSPKPGSVRLGVRSSPLNVCTTRAPPPSIEKRVGILRWRREDRIERRRHDTGWIVYNLWPTMHVSRVCCTTHYECCTMCAAPCTMYCWTMFQVWSAPSVLHHAHSFGVAPCTLMCCTMHRVRCTMHNVCCTMQSCVLHHTAL